MQKGSRRTDTKKDARKLHDLAAHTAIVNCIKLGRINAKLLVTGGEDRKVNIWEVGHTKALVSLSGHQSSVESVTFDAAEEFVAAGAVGGTVKLWDIDQGRVTRSFAGHRSSVTSVEFHPMKGDFVASGSADTNVKIWDLRRKACLQSYKGHAKGVCCLAFSPDGKWIASGSEDGEVKLWDLRTGQLLTSFGDHMARISGIQYHPKECLLATSSADRTVRLWDLDNFQSVDVLGPDSCPVRSMTFNPEGDAIMTAVSEGLRVWSWEPGRRERTVEMPWTRVCEMGVDKQKNRVVACSMHQTMVGVYTVDLGLLHSRPRGGSTMLDRSSDLCRSMELPSSMIQNMAALRGPLSDRKAKSGRSSSARSSSIYSSSTIYRQNSERENMNPVVEPDCESLFRLAEDVELVEFPPVLSKGIDPPRTAPASEYRRSPPNSRGASPQATPRNTPRNTPLNTPRCRSRVSSMPLDECTTNRGEDPLHSSRSLTARSLGQPQSCLNPDLTGRSTSRSMVYASVRSREQSLHHSAPLSSARSTSLPTTRSTARPARPNSQMVLRPGRRASDPSADTGWPEWTSNNSSLDFDSFRPRKLRNEGWDDEAAIAEMYEKRQAMAEILSTRLSSLQVVRAFWTRGDFRGAMRAVQRCNDLSVAEDILSAVQAKRNAFELDLIPDMVPSLKNLLGSSHDKYWLTVMKTIATLLRNFGNVIYDATSRPVSSLGVDLSFEQRRGKCLAAKAALQELLPRMEYLKEQKGAVGRQAEQLRQQLEAL
ncbi:hypothetical protein BSKO_01657 [Bryopsis sp. KO-2023]|nr:hypothetical protein BSKO_01657 [Bryopsis sp. KO-2023]